MPDSWTFSLYPQAAEGGGCFVPRVQPEPRGGPPDLERSLEEAERRARSKLRRYCAANRLDRLGTLAYASSCRDPSQLRADVGAFFRGLRCELAARRSHTRGRRSGIPAATGCTCISRSGATSANG